MEGWKLELASSIVDLAGWGVRSLSNTSRGNQQNFKLSMCLDYDRKITHKEKHISNTSLQNVKFHISLITLCLIFAMRLYFALLSLISCNFQLTGAYAPSCALVSRFAQSPLTSRRQSFATTHAICRNQGLQMIVPVNYGRTHIGLFPFPRNVKRRFVDVSTHESASPIGGGESQKTFLRKAYDATLGKIVALLLYLMVRYIVCTCSNRRV